jgi:hypothetical protein
VEASRGPGLGQEETKAAAWAMESAGGGGAEVVDVDSVSFVEPPGGGSGGGGGGASHLVLKDGKRFMV